MNWERDDQGRPTRPIYVVYEDALQPPRWLWWVLEVVLMSDIARGTVTDFGYLTIPADDAEVCK